MTMRTDERIRGKRTRLEPDGFDYDIAGNEVVVNRRVPVEERAKPLDALCERAAKWGEADLRKHPTATLELIDELQGAVRMLSYSVERAAHAEATPAVLREHNYFYRNPGPEANGPGHYYCLCGWEGPDRKSYWEHLPASGHSEPAPGLREIEIRLDEHRRNCSEPCERDKELEALRAALTAPVSDVQRCMHGKSQNEHCEQCVIASEAE